ncbi:hypothetical protein A2U01_0023526 [Trifolium medium]|uniref:Uncharacterized protein n=1 Tax=Trifolium medium TaxID=97028 RepID=A0A392NRQ1_9FABA|nr:hypothetical protein [Trifolium medium]
MHRSLQFSDQIKFLRRSAILNNQRQLEILYLPTNNFPSKSFQTLAAKVEWSSVRSNESRSCNFSVNIQPFLCSCVKRTLEQPEPPVSARCHPMRGVRMVASRLQRNRSHHRKTKATSRLKRLE